VRTDLATVVNKSVPSVQQAMTALVVMGRELDHAKTYEQIRTIERAAEALKILHADVDKVRCECEMVILLANKRIAHETEKIPKASGRPAKKYPRGNELNQAAKTPDCRRQDARARRSCSRFPRASCVLSQRGFKTLAKRRH
jgi:16S rRNA C1402 (ribose-2'-O) methylase RsmI